MSEPLRIVIVHEGGGYAATCMEAPDFVLFCPTLPGLKAGLSVALEGHFKKPMPYLIVWEAKPNGSS